MRATARMLAVCLVVAGIACGDSGNGPSSGGAGIVNLILETPYTNDGGLLIAVTGANVGLAASTSYELTHSAPGATGVTLLVRGNISGGIIAEITVPHRDRLSESSHPRTRWWRQLPLDSRHQRCYQCGTHRRRWS